MNETYFEKATEQAAAFQKMWVDTMSKMMQAAFTFSPTSPPTDAMRQVRSGMFQALTNSWEEFMRSPQFLEGMKQCMDNAVVFRRMSNEFMARMRNEMQAPSRDDIDTIMLTVRHMEKRLLDRVDELSAQVAELNQQLAAKASRRTGPRAPRKANNGVVVDRNTEVI